MSPVTPQSRGRASAAALFALALGVAGIAGAIFVVAGGAPRGEALQDALSPLVGSQDADVALVSGIILENYRETRGNAARWSGLYWGFTFAAAILSALAGVILKLESFLKDRDGLKKDVAVVLSVSAALLITLSTSGDFQRKWQANRMAAAELERLGYLFLQGGGEQARTFLAPVAAAMMKRHESILGSGAVQPAPPAATGPGSAPAR